VIDFADLKSDGIMTDFAPVEERAIQGEETWFAGMPTSAGVNVTERTALQLPAFLSTIVVLATDVAALPLRVYQKGEDGSREERPQHPVDLLFNRTPDRETTPIGWKQAWMGHVLEYGNGLAEIQRTGRGAPYALHLTDPQATRPKRRQSDNHLGYTLADGRWLPNENVLHVRGLSFDGIWGYNLVRLVKQAIGLGIAAESYSADYFANDSEPGGYIETPQKLGTEAAGRLRENWEWKHRGQGNRHRVGVLEQGAKFHPSSTDPEKAQLLEARKFQVLDVARSWRVPPHKVGDFSQAHLANIEASNIDYVMTALVGWLVAIEQEVNLKLFSEAEYLAGFFAEHNVNALLRGDTKGRFDAYALALDKAWMNRDEVRRRENLNPIGEEGGGRKFLVQAQYVPLDKAGDPAAMAPATGKAPKVAPADGDGTEPSLDSTGPPEDTAPAATQSRDALDGNQMFSLKRILNDIALGELPADAAWAMIRASFPTLTDKDIDAMVNPLLTFTPASAKGK
jgi:HK97 family phage portal protein